MMDCKVKPDCTECRDTGLDVNPLVIRRYACDLRRHGQADGGLPGLLERAANALENPTTTKRVLHRLIHEAQERWSATSEIPREEVLAWLDTRLVHWLPREADEQ